MLRQIGPRKRRTRQHVIADLAVHYVEGVILPEGHTTQRLGSDYGYDLLMSPFDEQGYAEPGMAFFQVKAAESLAQSGSAYTFDLDIRDYHLWINEKMPVMLILYDATRRRAYWLAVKDYFLEDPGRRPKRTTKSVRVRVPIGQPLNRQAITAIRNLVREAVR